MSTREIPNRELVAEADQLEEQGASSEALKRLRMVLDVKADAGLLCRYASLAMDLGKVEEARQALLQATMLEPTEPMGYTGLGISYLDDGRPEDAITQFEKSLAIEETAMVETLRGAAQLRIGRVEEGRRSFYHAIELDPSCDEAYYNLGLLLSLDDPKQAVGLLRRAVEIDPQYAIAHCELGWVLRHLGQDLEAEFHLRKSVELDASDGQAWVYLGCVLWAKGELLDAEHCLEKSVLVWPESSLTHWCLASFFEQSGRREEADFYYDAATRLNPGDRFANFRFGLFLSDLGDKVRARHYLERALEIDPTYEDAKVALADLD